MIIKKIIVAKKGKFEKGDNMKKKILIIVIVIIVIALVLFLTNYIKEKKDAKTEFLLDNENKYILEYIGAESIGGWASSNYYCEIDLNNKYIDCRYDFEYWFPEKVSKLELFIYSKTRKLVKRYKLTNEESETLKKLFEEYINHPETDKEKEENGSMVNFGDKIKIINNCYVLNGKDSCVTIGRVERKSELKQILKNIDEDLHSFLLKE